MKNDAAILKSPIPPAVMIIVKKIRPHPKNIYWITTKTFIIAIKTNSVEDWFKISKENE